MGGSGLSAAHITLLGKTESKTSALINFTLVTDFSLSLISPEFRVIFFYTFVIMDRVQWHESYEIDSDDGQYDGYTQ